MNAIDIPQIPSEVSQDGREIWEWAGALSRASQLADDIRKTQNALLKLGTRCGDCNKWMKSRECPAERNVNGRNHGPSSETFKCSQYAECWSVPKRRTELQEKLDDLLASVKSSQPGSAA